MKRFWWRGPALALLVIGLTVGGWLWSTSWQGQSMVANVGVRELEHKQSGSSICDMAPAWRQKLESNARLGELQSLQQELLMSGKSERELAAQWRATTGHSQPHVKH